MNKAVLKLICLFMVCLLAQGSAEASKFDFDIQTGYRQDELCWSIGGPYGHPNILSELTWKNLEIWEVSGGLRVVTDNGYYIRGSADYGRALSGSNRDSDYFGDDRIGEFSRSKSDASGSSVYDLSIAFGYQLNFCQNEFTIAPLVGYSLNNQYLKMRKGVQVFDEVADFTGSISGLNSSYKATFEGLFVGFDLTYQADLDIKILANLEYHVPSYKGSGNWNLRQEHFKNFRHSANGQGVIASIGLLYQISPKLLAGITCSYREFDAKNGKARTYALLDDGENQVIPVILGHPFNAVKWKSASFLITLKYDI